jgi:hypothetical protein
MRLMRRSPKARAEGIAIERDSALLRAFAVRTAAGFGERRRLFPREAGASCCVQHFSVHSPSGAGFGEGVSGAAKQVYVNEIDVLVGKREILPFQRNRTSSSPTSQASPISADRDSSGCMARRRSKMVG